MAAKRLFMRNVREILRLRWVVGRSQRDTARSLSISPSAVCGCIRRARAAGLGWPQVQELDDSELESRLYQPERSSAPKVLPDWKRVHQELRRKSVTLQLLWQEYREVHPVDGYSYSQYCDLYRRFRSKLDVVLRQEHRAGEKMFVDYAGATIPIICRTTGEVTDAQLFVAVLGASSYTFAEATATQKVPDWIESHIHAFEYFGGVTEVTVPDQLKSGVTRACRYEPLVQRTYEEMAQHYGTVIIPARPRKPRDKAKAEAGVLLAERWILAVLRHHRIYSLAEANRLIATCLEALNARPFQKMEGSRASLFEALDRPALKPLPSDRYSITEWSKPRVNIDYHVEVNKHYYSVPAPLVRELVEARTTTHTVEIFFKGRRVASHRRNGALGKYSTIKEHMPKAHQKHLEWTPSRLVAWGRKTGDSTATLIEKILESRPHPEQGYRACLGLLRLSRRHTAPRLEAACRRALHFGTHSYQSVKSILFNNLDQEELPEADPKPAPLPEHDNVRGASYYQ